MCTASKKYKMFEGIFEATVVLWRYSGVLSKLQTRKSAFCTTVNCKVVTNATFISRVIRQNWLNFEAFLRLVIKITQATFYIFPRKIPI